MSGHETTGQRCSGAHASDDSARLPSLFTSHALRTQVSAAHTFGGCEGNHLLYVIDPMIIRPGNELEARR